MPLPFSRRKFKTFTFGLCIILLHLNATRNSYIHTLLFLGSYLRSWPGAQRLANALRLKIYFTVNPFLQYCFELICLETEKSIKLSYSQVINSWLFGLKTKQPIPRPKRTTLSVLNNSYRSETAVFQLFDKRLFTLFDRTKHYARISCRVSCRWRQRPTINERAWHMTVTLGVPSVLPYPGGDDTLPAALPALARSRAVITHSWYLFSIRKWTNFLTYTLIEKKCSTGY